MKDLALESDQAEAADIEAFRRAVLGGLSRRPRSIPAKFLYDAEGSALFDRICELPEYYLTRSEAAILQARAPEIATRAGPNCGLIEFGSGSSIKSRLLLDAMDLAFYAPIDISREHLDRSVTRLRQEYPGLPIVGICADYMALDSLSDLPVARRRIGFFPGSSIGNLMPEQAVAFFRGVRVLLGKDGGFILGVDLKKDTARLEAAYNDRAGVTAAFSLNLLRRMNRELQATFDLSAFAHEARYNQEQGRIEIHLRSLRDQDVSILGRNFPFLRGERIHTEYSYKFDEEGLSALAARGGLRLERLWTDDERLFAVAWLTST